MKRRKVVTLGILLAGALATMSQAAERGPALPGQQQPQNQVGQAALSTRVPQAQIELMQKREDLRERRDILQAMRRQALEAGPQEENVQ